MGLDPGDGDYEGGVACATCEATLFGGKTPKYVLATFHNTVACPVFMGQSIDGAYLLTQQPLNPCSWNALVVGRFWITYDVSPTSGLLVSMPLMWQSFFSDLNNPICQDLFFNTTVCGPVGVKTTGGIGVISWGPDTGLPCP